MKNIFLSFIIAIAISIPVTAQTFATSDAVQKTAQIPLQTVSATLSGSGMPLPSYLRFSDLTLTDVSGGGVSYSGLPIVNGTVIINTTGFSQAFNASGSFTGHITELDMNDSGAGVSPPFSGSGSATVNGTIDIIGVSQNILTSVLTISTNQSAPLGITGGGNGAGGAINISAASVTSLSVAGGGNLVANGMTFEIDSACSSAATTSFLQAFIGGSSTSGIIIMGGSSGTPIITPQIETLTYSSPPSGSDTEEIQSADNSLHLSVVYSSGIPFASSALVSGTLTVGISNSPTVTQIATLLSASMNTVGWSTTHALGVVTSTDAVYAHWPIANTTGGTSHISIAITQSGDDKKQTLITNGNTVTTN